VVPEDIKRGENFSIIKQSAQKKKGEKVMIESDE
jgi:hypothetical protein